MYVYHQREQFAFLSFVYFMSTQYFRVNLCQYFYCGQLEDFDDDSEFMSSSPEPDGDEQKYTG